MVVLTHERNSLQADTLNVCQVSAAQTLAARARMSLAKTAGLGLLAVVASVIALEGYRSLRAGPDAGVPVSALPVADESFPEAPGLGSARQQLAVYGTEVVKASPCPACPVCPVPPVCEAIYEAQSGRALLASAFGGGALFGLLARRCGRRAERVQTRPVNDDGEDEEEYGSDAGPREQLAAARARARRL